MTATATGIGSVLAAILWLCALPAYGQAELSFKIEYDLEINVADESRSVKSRAYVRDRETIPIEIGRYQAEIRISRASPSHYEIEFRVSESLNEGGVGSDVARVSFSGEDGVPVSLKWGAAGIDINLQFVASGDRQ